jgi:hypothetical protein
MSINTVSGSAGANDIGQLVQRLVTASDKNKDRNLSMGEFASFLTTLIDHISPGRSAADGSADSAATLTVAPSMSASVSVASALLLPTPPGWDQTKWADPHHRTTKYDVGHVLAKFPATSAGLQEAWLELSALYPEATFDGKDTISGLPGTNGPVDVLVGASVGGRAWAWQDTGS